MTVTNKSLSKHFGVTTARVNEMINEGMPTDSIESAEAWRRQKLLRGKQGGQGARTRGKVDDKPINPDDDFEQTVVRHRELKEAARLTYIAARESGAASAPKDYITYQNILKTLVVIEREALARRIESREVIPTAIALDKFGKVLGEIKADLIGLPLQIASQLNPNNPGLALKVLDKHLTTFLAKWARTEAQTTTATAQPVKTSRPSIDAMGEDDDDA